jgi:hypothetical protein
MTNMRLYVYFIINSFTGKNNYYFYYNRGISKTKLFIIKTIRTFLFIAILIIIYQYVQHS